MKGEEIMWTGKRSKKGCSGGRGTHRSLFCCLGAAVECLPACLLAFSPDLLGRQQLLNISFEVREFLPTNCRSRWLQPSLPSPLLGEKTRYWYASPFLVFLLTLR